MLFLSLSVFFLALFLCSLVLSWSRLGLVFVLSFLRLVRFAFVIFVLSWSRLCFLASHLLLSCCVSCRVFVLRCLVSPLSLSLFCLICVVLVFLLCCAVCLSSWVALSTHFWSVWVVSGVDVGHFGSSWGALGRILGGLLGLLGGLGGAWNGLESG